MCQFVCLVLVLLTMECLTCVMMLLYQPAVLASFKKVIQSRLIHVSEEQNKFALLWGEAQLCLPYVCL